MQTNGQLRGNGKGGEEMRLQDKVHRQCLGVDNGQGSIGQ